ncbi:MAG: signal peptidase I [Iamia sp.]
MTPPDEPDAPTAAPAASAGPTAGQRWLDDVPSDPEDPAEVQDQDEDHDDGAGDEAGGSARDRRVRSAIEWVAVIAGAVVVALVVRTFLFTTFWIPSGSMEPTLMGQGRRDRVIVNRLSYKLHDVNRGDIIVFKVPAGEATLTIDGQKVQDLIKRVVGLPGENVSLRDGDVYIDGEKLDEGYLEEGVQTEDICGEGSEWVVPEDAVFVMGDNRPMSQDARCWASHSVPESDIVGRAFVRIWPLTEITLF